jgi:hypothetical protein
MAWALCLWLCSRLAQQAWSVASEAVGKMSGAPPRFRARWSSWALCARSARRAVCRSAARGAVLAYVAHRLLQRPALVAGVAAALNAVEPASVSGQPSAPANALLGAASACLLPEAGGSGAALPRGAHVALAAALVWIARDALHALASFALILPAQLISALLRWTRCAELCIDAVRVNRCLRRVGTSRRALAALERAGGSNHAKEDEEEEEEAVALGNVLAQKGVQVWVLRTADGALLDAVYVPPEYCGRFEADAVETRVGVVAVCNGSGESFRRSFLRGDSQLLEQCVARSLALAPPPSLLRRCSCPTPHLSSHPPPRALPASP